jgi:hypothetical protein
MGVMKVMEQMEDRKKREAGAVQGGWTQGDGGLIEENMRHHNNNDDNNDHRVEDFLGAIFFFKFAKIFTGIFFAAQSLKQINCDELRITRVGERRRGLRLISLILRVLNRAQGRRRAFKVEADKMRGVRDFICATSQRVLSYGIVRSLPT